jgi:hypothetical protein
MIVFHAYISNRTLIGTISLRKAKLDAKLEHEFINNFKLLQGTMKKVNIEKVACLFLQKYQHKLTN